MTSVNQTPASETRNLVTISKEDYPRIIWKLQHIEGVIDFLHEKLIELKQETKLIALPSLEVGGFCDVLHDDAYVGLCDVSDQLIESDVNGFQQVGHELRNIANYAGFVLNFLLPNLPPGHESEHRNIYRSDVNSIFFLIEEIWNGLPICIHGFKNFTSADLKKRAREKGAYGSAITKRSKAIQPKFKALYDKYIFPGGSELLTDPKGVGKETKNLRNEIFELQNRMPVESEEAMDCRLAIDHLDFLIKLIDSKFNFAISDLIAISLVVGQASDVFNQSLVWLTPDNGGGLAKKNIH
ncbi:MAG: hypothetical protein Q8M57_14520 [Nitrosomonas sp.]|uniref:hypothetical protein n=1 Tax=Nitrosomonas sp. TaxID=42353 RepID=UPI0027332C4C|nr:hypothetical protein [Nitrosomonas sp.]MDP3282232.1 hypothetical protein [Nitrosomonas sp.]